MENSTNVMPGAYCSECTPDDDIEFLILAKAFQEHPEWFFAKAHKVKNKGPWHIKPSCHSVWGAYCLSTYPQFSKPCICFSAEEGAAYICLDCLRKAVVTLAAYKEKPNDDGPSLHQFD